VADFDARRSELLYDATGLGMLLYIRSSFKVVLLGRENLRMRPGMLVVSSHRTDSDVPLLCVCHVFTHRMLFRHRLRLHYAARDDIWEPGVLAGMAPARTPSALRRLLFRLDLAPYVDLVRAHPLRIAAEVQAVQALRRADPYAPIPDVLPGPLAERFRERGATVVHEALRAEFADLLWSDVDRHEFPEARDLWRWRAYGAAADVRTLARVLRAGEPLLIYPEGEPSHDGAIGPLLGGLDVLVRRGHVTAVLPIGIAYDAFTRGRPRVCVAVGAPVDPPASDADAELLLELRRRTPLTCGQVVAHRLVALAEAGEGTMTPAELDRALADAVEDARATARRIDPPLERQETRRRRLTECLRVLVRRGVLSAPTERRLALDPARIAQDADIRFAATEYASAREDVRDAARAG
jgi:1-acyl-sn-glycerol-3-phosphate acyltransferase